MSLGYRKKLEFSGVLDGTPVFLFMELELEMEYRKIISLELELEVEFWNFFFSELELELESKISPMQFTRLGVCGIVKSWKESRKKSQFWIW